MGHDGQHLLAAALIAFFAIPAAADDAAPPVPANPVVRVGDVKDRWFCSGFYVGDNTVITAGHCFFGDNLAPAYHVRLDNGEVADAVLAVMSNVEAGFDDYAI